MGEQYVSEDESLAQFRAGVKRLAELQYHRYEVASFSQINACSKKNYLTEYLLNPENTVITRPCGKRVAVDAESKGLNCEDGNCYRSRHNMHYWIGGEYIGFGVGAVQRIGLIRSTCVSTISQFMDGEWHYKDEELTDENLRVEAIMLGLRTVKGISTDLLSEEAKGKINKFMKDGLVAVEEGRIRLTDMGFEISNTIISELI